MVAALFIVAVFAWGLAFYSLGFYLRELHRLHGWSVSSLSWVTLLFYATATLLTFLVSRLLAAFGPRWVFVAGGTLLGAGVAVVGHVATPWQLVVGYLILAGGWASLNLYPISAVVLAWFPERNGPPLALALTGASAGGIIMIPLLTALTERFGLATALSLVGGTEVAVVGILAIAVIGRAPPSHSPDGSGHPVDNRIAWYLARTKRFWVLLSGLALGFAVQVGFLVHQLSLLADSVEDATASRIVGATTAAALVGRLVFMALSSRWVPRVLGAWYLVGQIVALAALGLADGDTLRLTLGCALFGWGVGVLITIPPLLVRSTFPDVAFGAAFPVFNVGLQLAIAAGAPLTALLHDLLGGYSGTVAALAAIDVVGCGLLIGTRRGPGVVDPAPTIQVAGGVR